MSAYLRNASERLAAVGGSHTHQLGCFDGFPEQWQLEEDMPETVDCEACRAIWDWYAALMQAVSWRDHLNAIRHLLVGTPPNVDGIDAAIGSALNDCEASVDAALAAEAREES